jgi:hypothetical protein
MSGIKGFSSSLKNIKAPKAHPNAKTEQQFVTVTPTGYDKHGLDVVLKAHYPLSLSPITIDAIQPSEDADRVLNITGHGMRQGDILRFSTGSSLEGIESEIVQIVDANTIVLGTKLPSVPVAGTDTVELLRGVTLRTGSDGSLVATSGPLQYQLTSGAVTTAVTVLKDEDTPANTRPLPVELISTNGTPATFNITTGEINVALTHDGVSQNYDSVRIGDGTELAAVNASNQLEVNVQPITNVLPSVRGKRPEADSLSVTLASDEATITIDTLQLPATLGQKDKSTSLAVTLASDEDNINIDSTQLPTSLGKQATGASLSVTLATGEEIDVRDLTHIGAVNFDSVRIGDGVETANVTTDNKLLVKAQDIEDVLPVGRGRQAEADSLSVTLATAEEVDIRDLTAASDSVRLGDGTTLVDVTLTNQLKVQADQLPSALSSQVRANSLSVTLATDEPAITVDATNLDIRALTTTEDTVQIGNGANTLGVNASGEASVTAAQLPTTLGAKTTANSLSVTLSTDEPNISVVQAANDGLSVSRALTLASTPIAIPAPAGANMIQLQAASTNTEAIFIGGSVSVDETNGWELLPGASVEIEVGEDVYYYSTVGSERLNYIWTTRS